MVFTCVTDTGRLIWTVNNDSHVQSFHMISQIKMIVKKQIFELELVNVTGVENETYISTATAHNVLPDYNGTRIACVDGDQTNTSMTLYVLIGEKLDHTSCQCLMQLYTIMYSITSISTPQPDLHLLPHPLLCHYQLGSATGHTPLCTQLHCHC